MSLPPDLKRTLRTVVQIIVFAAGALPSVVMLTGLSQQIPAVAGSLVFAAAVTRVMQAPAVQPALRWLGLDVPSSPES